MKGSGTAEPPYPAIQRLKDVKTNLFSDFVCMDEGKGFGKVTNDLVKFFDGLK